VEKGGGTLVCVEKNREGGGPKVFLVFGEKKAPRRPMKRGRVVSDPLLSEGKEEQRNFLPLHIRGGGCVRKRGKRRQFHQKKGKRVEQHKREHYSLDTRPKKPVARRRGGGIASGGKERRPAIYTRNHKAS